MLTKILLNYLRNTSLVLIVVGTAIAFLLGGVSSAIAFFIGAALVLGSGALQVWLVGMLLDEEVVGSRKAVVGLLLVCKLFVVAAILWGILVRVGPDALGLLVGMGVGLAGLVISLNQGSQSPQGISEINRRTEKIAEKLEDNESEKR